MPINLRTAALDAAWPVLQRVGHMHWPYSKRLMTEKMVLSAMEILKPGDIMTTRICGEPSNLLQWGAEVTHVGVYGSILTSDWRLVTESVSPTVRISGLYDFMMSKDVVVIARNVENTEEQNTRACFYARTCEGWPYDKRFEIEEDPTLGSPNGPKAVYCAELAYRAHKMANPKMRFTPRLIGGAMTVLPGDFIAGNSHFKVVWDSRRAA